MQNRLVKDIKGIYRAAKKEMCFSPIFERKLARYIQNRTPRGSVNWQKLRYEFRTISRKCRDRNLSLKVYLGAMATLTSYALGGKHKKIEIVASNIGKTGKVFTRINK